MARCSINKALCLAISLAIPCRDVSCSSLEVGIKLYSSSRCSGALMTLRTLPVALLASSPTLSAIL